MSIGQCQKNGNGEVAGTNLGKDQATALENQQAWGDSSVCQDNNGDYYVLHGAVDLAIKADASPDDLRKKVVSLKSQSDDMASDISGLRVQIEKDKSTLAELGKSQGWFSKLLHDPVSGFFVEAGTVALAFGLVTSMAEDALSLSMLNNAASRDLALQKLKNQYLQSLGGCAAPIRGQQAKLDVKRAAIGAGVVGGVVAANSLLRGNGGDSAGQAPAVENSQPLPDLSSMSDADLKKLYQTLLSNYEAMGKTKAELVTQKTSLESEIIKKGGTVEKETPLDSVMGNRTVRLMADAAAAFGIGSTLIRSRYQTYFKFHDKVEEGLRALDAQAKAQAVNEIAAGKCAAEPATAAEPVTATAADQTMEMSSLTAPFWTRVETSIDSGEEPMGLPEGVVTVSQGALIDRYQTTIAGLTVGLPASLAHLNGIPFQTVTEFNRAAISETDYAAQTAVLSRDMAEADFGNYLNYVPGAAAGVATLPRNLPSEFLFLATGYNYYFSEEDFQKFQNVDTKNLAEVLVKTYATDDAMAARIRADVPKLFSPYSRPDQPAMMMTRINGAKWALQWYLPRLAAGRLPSEAAVNATVAYAQTSGIVGSYFEIEESIGGFKVNRMEMTFAEAAARHWKGAQHLKAEQAVNAEAARRGWQRAKVDEGHAPEGDFSMGEAGELYYKHNPVFKDADGDYHAIDIDSVEASVPQGSAVGIPIAPMVLSPVIMTITVPSFGFAPMEPAFI